MGREIKPEEVAEALVDNLFSKSNVRGIVPVEWSEIDERASLSKTRAITFDDFDYAIRKNRLITSTRIIKEKWRNMLAEGAIQERIEYGTKYYAVLSIIKGMAPKTAKIEFGDGTHTQTHSSEGKVDA